MISDWAETHVIRRPSAAIYTPLSAFWGLLSFPSFFVFLSLLFSPRSKPETRLRADWTSELTGSCLDNGSYETSLVLLTVLTSTMSYKHIYLFQTISQEDFDLDWRFWSSFHFGKFSSWLQVFNFWLLFHSVSVLVPEQDDSRCSSFLRSNTLKAQVKCVSIVRSLPPSVEFCSQTAWHSSLLHHGTTAMTKTHKPAGGRYHTGCCCATGR